MNDTPKELIAPNIRNFIYEELLDFCKSISKNHETTVEETLCFITDALSRIWIYQLKPKTEERVIENIRSLFTHGLNGYNKLKIIEDLKLAQAKSDNDGIY